MTEKNVSHTKWMKRAIFLASLGKNTTSPNPRVGAVILDKNGKLISEGFHFKAGMPHAEAMAFNNLKKDAKGGSIYVNLEPCCFLFKLKSKPAALYQSLGGFAINGVNLTKLQSYPEKNSFDSYFFLCDLDGHIEDSKVQKSLEELGLHCEDFHVLGVFEADSLRQNK